MDKQRAKSFVVIVVSILLALAAGYYLGVQYDGRSETNQTQE